MNEYEQKAEVERRKMIAGQSGAVEIAADALMKALDANGRAAWRQSILMALSAIRENGYADGYRVAANGLPGLLKPGAGISSWPHDDGAAQPLKPEGEDKALAKIPANDPDLDLGWQFLEEFARQLGAWARSYDVTPGCARLTPSIHSSVSSLGYTGDLKFSVEHLTVKG